MILDFIKKKVTKVYAEISEKENNNEVVNNETKN